MTEALAKYVDRLEAQLCIYLAGRIAERRARRCDDSRRCELLLTESQRLAAHESGHAVVGIAVGWRCHGVTILPEPDVAVGRGQGYLGGFAAFSDAPSVNDMQQRRDHLRKATRPMESDEQTAAQLALQLALLEPDFGWRAALRVIRRLRARTEVLVDQNWRKIKYLARELEWRREMTDEQIQVCLRSAVVAWPNLTTK